MRRRDQRPFAPRETTSTKRARRHLPARCGFTEERQEAVFRWDKGGKNRGGQDYEIHDESHDESRACHRHRSYARKARAKGEPEV